MTSPPSGPEPDGGPPARGAASSGAIARRGVQGAAWTIAMGIAARAVGVVGTLILMHFLSPAEYGEVSVAVVVVITANQFSIIGFGQYVIARPKAGRDVVFHASAFHLSLGVLAVGAVLLARNHVGRMFDAPAAGRYIPGLALGMFFDRVSFMPERLLSRDMRFRTLSLARGGSELVYSVVSVATGAMGWGAMAVVAGNLARSVVRALVMVTAVDWREWLTPSPLRKDTTRDLLSFGVPVAIGAAASFASRRWDNLLVSRFFGPAIMGAYNLAYNLAEIPTSLVGEQIGDVLMPSFAHLPPEKRSGALVRSTALLSLIMFPLAVGLGTVARTLTATVLDARWEHVGPMLTLLAGLAVTRPIGWTVGAYLQAANHPRLVMLQEVFTVAALVLALSTVGRPGPAWACGAVGLAFAARAVLSLLAVRMTDRVPVFAFVRGMIPPLLACAPMVAAVLGARWLLAPAGPLPRGVGLVVECVVGAVTYVGAAFLVAGPITRDFLNLVRNAVRRRGGAKAVT